jgi:hypothetical protein
MKTAHLLASFAVAATAAAADLKDPALVAREFNDAAKPTLPLVGPADLRAASVITDKPLPRPEGSFQSAPRARRTPQVRWGRIPRDKIYDAPNYRVPEALPDNMPPGSKVWRYGGQDYYLIPLIPSPEN